MFFGLIEKKKTRWPPSLWLAETFSTSPLKALNELQRNLTGSKISTFSTKFVFFEPIRKNKSPKGHWSLTWVQWALLLKVRFLSKSESMTAIFVKSVRTATITIFQFRIQGCIRFVDVAFRSEEEVFWRRNPSLTYFWQIPPPPGSATRQSLPKSI